MRREYVAQRRRLARKLVAELEALVADRGAFGERRFERRLAAERRQVGPHLELLAEGGATVMVYGEVADSIQGAPLPLYKRPRFVARRRNGATTASG